MKNWGKVCLMCLALTACSSDKKLAPTEGRLSLVEHRGLLPASGQPSFDKKKNHKVVEKAPFVFQVKESDKTWTASLDKAGNEDLLTFPKIIALDKKIYALDGRGDLVSFDLNGKKLSRTKLEANEAPLSLATNGEKIVAVSQKGKVFVMAKDGKLLWQKDYAVPFRNTPVLDKETLYLLSATNDLWVLGLTEGEEQWHYKTTLPATSWWKMASPALGKEGVVVPFSNGAVMAFHPQNGSFLWQEEMFGTKAFNQFDQMTQMIASPVMKDSVVYLVGHNDVSKALDLKTGEKIWEIPVGGETTPLVYGNTLFILDNQQTLWALDKSNGRSFWKTPVSLEKGPYALFFVNETLLLLGPQQIIQLNPKTGKVSREIALKKKVSFPTITSDGFYFITQDNQVLYKGKIQ